LLTRLNLKEQKRLVRKAALRKLKELEEKRTKKNHKGVSKKVGLGGRVEH
jgi:hypothetical protein